MRQRECGTALRLTPGARCVTGLRRAAIESPGAGQKFMGIATGVYGFISGLLSLQSFAGSCVTAQPTSFNLTSYPGVGTLNISFKFGVGAALMFVATALKAIDVVLHLIVPTPPPRHAPPPDGLGELPSYLAHGASSETRFGYPAHAAFLSEHVNAQMLEGEGAARVEGEGAAAASP